MPSLYNEIDPYAAAWLRNLIAAGHIAHGVVDTRSIAELSAADVAGYTQVHFFAGIGGWSLAARLAGWPDDRPLWTGSCPCQPFSVAGAGAGQADARHLWPEFFRLIAACRPPVVMGEQVAAAVGKSWLDGVCSDLEGIGYATGAVVVPACAVDAPHRRDRLWFVAHPESRGDMRPNESGGVLQQRFESGALGSRAHAHGAGLSERIGDGRIQRETLVTSKGQTLERAGDGTMANAGSGRLGGPSQGQAQQPRRTETVGAGDCYGPVGHADQSRADAHTAPSTSRYSVGEPSGRGSFWHDSQLAVGADGKARRVKPGIRLLAHGIPARVGKLRAFGNAIVPQVAEQVLRAYMDCTAAAVLKC